MSRADLFWWVALPYMAIAIFVVGHIWRYRRDQLGWTARSTQLLEQRLLKWGSLLFHFGVIAVIGGVVTLVVLLRLAPRARPVSQPDASASAGSTCSTATTARSTSGGSSPTAPTRGRCGWRTTART